MPIYNVMFLDLPNGRYFVAGKRMWTRLASQPEEELLVSLWENLLGELGMLKAERPSPSRVEIA